MFITDEIFKTYLWPTFGWTNAYSSQRYGRLLG